jgi:hypothetical protein
MMQRRFMRLEYIKLHHLDGTTGEKLSLFMELSQHV